MQPKGLTDLTLELVAVHSQFQIFLGDNQSKAACRIGGCPASKYQQCVVTDFDIGLIEYPFEIMGIQQTKPAAERLIAHPPAQLLDGQTLAAFGATTGQYLAAVLGGHAGTKAMDAFTLQIAGLECSFHGTFASVRSVRWFSSQAEEA